MIKNLSYLFGIVVATTGSAVLWQEVIVQSQWGTKEAMRDGLLLLSGIIICLVADLMDRRRA